MDGSPPDGVAPARRKKGVVERQATATGGRLPRNIYTREGLPAVW